MSTVLITEPIATGAIDRLRGWGYGVHLAYADAPMSLLPETVEAALVRSGPITRAWMMRFPNLKIIAYHGVGVEDIDIDAARDLGLCVTTTPGGNALSVAEHAMALLLSLFKQIPQTREAYRSEGFGVKYAIAYSELSGKTLGLIGAGDIGMKLAAMAHFGFGMRVVAFDPHRADWPDYVAPADRLAVFEEADAISLHLPLNPTTRHSVGRAEFDAMKPTAFLVNTARGGVIDEAALIEALEKRSITGAGLDVSNPEPCAPDSPLLRLPNVILTPHVAASTAEALNRVADMAATSIHDYLSGREPQGRVV